MFKKKKGLPCPCKTMHMTMVLVLHFDSWTSEKELLTQIIAILSQVLKVLQFFTGIQILTILL